MNDKINILLVEDNRLICFNMQKAIEDCGFNVHVAGRKSEVDKVLESVTPEIIIMDVNLNDVEDGIDILKEIHVAHGFVKNIIMTGYARQEIMGRAADCKPESVLEKPIDTNALCNILFKIFPQKIEQ